MVGPARLPTGRLGLAPAVVQPVLYTVQVVARRLEAIPARRAVRTTVAALAVPLGSVSSRARLAIEAAVVRIHPVGLALTLDQEGVLLSVSRQAVPGAPVRVARLVAIPVKTAAPAVAAPAPGPAALASKEFLGQIHAVRPARPWIPARRASARAVTIL